MDKDTFLVGINTFIIKDNKILLGKRISKKGIAGGDGMWELPGGHLEKNESMREAAQRELFEETGIICSSFSFLNVMNQPLGDGRHYIHISFLAQNPAGEPTVKEPDKCGGWQWFDLNNLPENIFSSHGPRIHAFVQNKSFIDSKN